MAYEFTKKKLKAERKAFMMRLFLTVTAGAAGLAFGVSGNDMGSIWDVLAASALSSYAGLGTLYLAGIVVGHC